ncbi:uncharacterized protein [Diabrotica undecimpunctata]|uniref:uncharacterized protein n=1 Tax=Diabrotica undecimpunctata TaxID=50387 RepID=UPI003B636DB0
MSFKQNLKIIQWNARSLKANKNYFYQILMEEKFDIAIISETWYKPTDNIKFNNFNVIAVNRDKGYGGVAIFISHKIIYEVIQFNHNFNPKIEVFGINIILGNQKLAIVSLYKPSDVRAKSQDYINLFSQIKHDCIIGGDFNAHHGMWGSPACSHDGRVLVDALDHFPNLIVINDGSATRISPPGQAKSAVDLTIASSKVCPTVGWSVSQDTYGSDHYPISITLNNYYYNDAITSPLYRWSMYEANWTLYTAEIEKSFSTPPNCIDTNGMCIFLMEQITNAANKACNILGPSSNISLKSPKWWDEECRDNCDSLKQCFVIPIPKANDPNVLRPISLMSCILKTFERIMKNRLEWWMESNNLYPDGQLGFRRGKGTMDCISHLATDIQLTYSKNQYTAALFVDISGAYDNVILDLLLDQLVKLGVPSKCAYVLVNLFTNRQVHIRLNNSLIGPRIVNKGLPQGSVLSPLLFNLYSLNLHTMGMQCNILQYAGDFCFYVEKKTFQQCVNALEVNMSYCKKYFDSHGLNISPKKSGVVFFSRHRLPKVSTLKFSQLEIPVYSLLI